MTSIFQFIKSGVLYRSRQLVDPIIREIYWLYARRKANEIRKKENISVAFIVSETALWKSEYLYMKMREHPRFSPIILITPMPDAPKGADQAVEYCKSKGYAYHFLEGKETIQSVAHPDIILYQKPYDVSILPRYGFRRNLKSLFCYVYYSFHNVKEKATTDTPLTNIAWQLYYENDEVMEFPKQVMKNHNRNGIVTGLPMTDILTMPIDTYPDPWKKTEKPLKRIIWGPHHSIGNKDHGGINYSTFLEVADFMLEMAQTYKDKVQFAFKPHTLLAFNLQEYWSKERIAEYFKAWEEMENTQLELGGYNGLFMHSDAMIHDSGSFTLEYMYTKKPVMYLLKEPNADHTANQTAWAKDAFMLHYHGTTKEDIRRFIEQVIANDDPLKDKREDFYRTSLLPPNGCSASENIINAILGIKPYK